MKHDDNCTYKHIREITLKQRYSDVAYVVSTSTQHRSNGIYLLERNFVPLLSVSEKTIKYQLN